MKLGLTLQQLAEMGISPPARPSFGMPTQPTGTPPIWERQPPQQQAPPQQKPIGMGKHIAGAIGDVLLQQAGMQPMFSPAMQQRRAMEQSEAQWSRRRQAENEDWTQRQEWQRANPDPSPMLRDIAAWQAMTPEQRVAYEAMQKAKEGDPLVNMSLPNGQFYSGPRSGLATALGGGTVPAAPVGRLTPIDGGPAPAPGNFRP